jgi:hypothetical protein
VGGPAAALHKLQLVSGRPLTTIPLDVGGRPARFCGLAVTRNGSVYVLDAAAARLWKLMPGERVASLLQTLDVQNPAGLALDDAPRYAYISHETGLARLTLSDGSLAPLTAAGGVKLAAVESLVWHRGSLIAHERQAPGASRLVRLRLNGRGTSVVRVDVLDPEVSTCGGPTAVTASGTDVYYLAADRRGETDCSLMIRRVRIE